MIGSCLHVRQHAAHAHRFLEGHRRAADDAGAVAERRVEDFQMARGERQGPLVNALADRGQEHRSDMRNAASDEDVRRVEEIDDGCQHLPDQLAESLMIAFAATSRPGSPVRRLPA
jgi:hypothetical protein